MVFANLCHRPQQMQLKTILNHCHKFKCFIYGSTRFVASGSSTIIEVDLHARMNSKARCSGCSQAAPCYDTLNPRRDEFIPILGYPVFFCYARRRVNCASCGIKVERVPWSEGKKQLTTTYMIYLAQWAKILSWQEVARHFRTSWAKVFQSAEYVVNYGLLHRELNNIEAIGVDEIARRKGHNYLTVVYQIDHHQRRLLHIEEGRTESSLNRFFDMLGQEASDSIKYVCSDMWKAYLNVLKKRARNALHILDRYHIAATMNKAIDKVRAEEHRSHQTNGFEPVLSKSRWCLLKKRSNLNTKQTAKLKDLLQYNLKSIKSYLLKEDFARFWEYRSAAWAGKFLDEWCTRTMYSKIEPMKDVAKMLRRHKPLILNYFRAKKTISNGVAEGFNNKCKVIARKSYGFRTVKCHKVALYHALGDLPLPETTHRFY